MNAILLLAWLPAIGLALDPLTHNGSLTDQLRSPARIAVASDGTVYVTETFDSRLVAYNAGVHPAVSWPIAGGPVGIAVHPTNGHFYMSLRDEGKVGIYTYDDGGDTFNFAGYLGAGDSNVTFVRPTDIAIGSGTGRIYVVDPEDDKWYVFNANDTLRAWGGVRGVMPGEFKYPSAIVADEANDRMIIADQDNFRLQVYTIVEDNVDPDLTYHLFEFKFGYRIKYGLPGEPMEGWMPRTQGVAVDADGNMYVADALMGTVRISDPTGLDYGRVVVYGATPGDLRAPCDLAIHGGQLYVVSTNTSSVELYDLATLPGGRGGSSPGEGSNPPGSNACPLDVQRQEIGTLKGPIRVLRRATKGSAPISDPPAAESSIGPWEPELLDSRSYTGPHMIDEGVICGRCHGINDQPGGMVAVWEGQANLCMSCHTGGGQGMDMAFHELDLADPLGTNPNAVDGRGRSHAWGVPAINSSADSVGPDPTGPMGLHLDAGDMKCSTCHNPHNNEADAPYLRMINDEDQMCKHCHAPRDEGLGERGTHPVGFDYPGGVGEFPADVDVAPMHVKNENVECMTCHALHEADSGGANAGEGDGMLLRDVNDETFCQTCHTEHAIHDVRGDWQPICTDCHKVHDPTSENLSLVSTLLSGTPVTFQDNDLGDNGLHDFIHSNHDPAGYNGVCEVCHTSTTHHQNNAAGDHAHNASMVCTDCHPHDSGFLPTGGSCVDCHSTAQDNGDGVPPGGRRAVVGEFPEGDAHAHYGAELGSDACTVCHSIVTHMDGYVELIDPDDGSIYRFMFVEDLTADPDVSNFCAGCHDADGASRLPDPFDPFGSATTPPDVATQFLGTLQWDEWYGDWCFGSEGTLRAVNSHHDISTNDQNISGAKLECLSCHGAHTASASQPLADPFFTITPWTGSNNGFCLACHYGGFGPDNPGFPAGVQGPVMAMRGIDVCIECINECCPDGMYNMEPWWVDYSWTHEAHGADSKRDWDGYSGAPGYELDCVVCHDPHGSYTPTNTFGNPYMIRDVVDGTPFVDDGVRPGTQWTGPPWNTYGTARPVVVSQNGIDVDWGGGFGGGTDAGLCNVCHADWQAAYGWHGSCSGCQTCHGHGQSWGGSDLGTGGVDDSTHCGFPPTCGDGVAEGCEECDDGNTQGGDGCSSDCLLEGP